MFSCNHIWKKIDKEVLPSGYEQMQANGQSIKSAWNGELLAPLFKKKVVWLFQCEKCSEVKTVTEENP